MKFTVLAAGSRGDGQPYVTLAAGLRSADQRRPASDPRGGSGLDKAGTCRYPQMGRVRRAWRTPTQRGLLLHDDDFTIAAKYQAEYAGLVQYYLLARDVFRLGRLHWMMETSLLKTLAGKHRSTVGSMARTYKTVITTPAGPRKVLQVTVHRSRSRKPLVTRFGGIPLRRARIAVLTDQRPVMASAKRNELIHRLLAGARLHSARGPGKGPGAIPT